LNFDNQKTQNLSFAYLNPKYHFQAKAEYFLVSNHLLQDAITKIAQVTQTLDRLAIKYILGVFPLNDEQREKQFLQYVSQNKNSLLLYHPQGFIDLGWDDSHPGPKHHKWYADTILDFYNEIK
jgi:UDP-N-acetylglucosamine 2-epimerase